VTATYAGVLTVMHAVQAPSADKVTPGILGFSVTFALVIAVVLLIRSMVGHLRKVRYSPEPGTGSASAPVDKGEGSPAGSGSAES